MRDTRHADKPDKRRAAVFRIIEPPVSFAERTATEQVADSRGKIFLKGVLEDRTGKTCHALHGFERDVAGKAVTNDNVDFTVENIPAFNVADVVQRCRRKFLARAPGQIITLAVLLAVAQHANPWTRDAENALGIDGAHESELYQMARFTVDIRTGIDNHRAFGHARYDNENRRTSNLRERAHHEHTERHHRSRIPGADYGVGFAMLHQLERDAH